MARVLPVALALLLIPGCLEAGSFSPRAIGAAEYRLVLVEGAYERASQLSGVCGFASLPEIDEEARTIVFHNERPPRDARALVLAIVWDRSGCGVASTMWATLDEPTGVASLELAGLGVIDVEFLDEGEVRVNGQPLSPGGLTIDAAGDGWNATASFRNAGAWPTKGIRLA